MRRGSETRGIGFYLTAARDLSAPGFYRASRGADGFVQRAEEAFLRAAGYTPVKIFLIKSVFSVADL
jgi:hypothetical protein